MAATRATFRGLSRRHWRVAVTVAMYSIVRTEARPPQTRCWPRYRFRGATPARAAISRPLRRPSPSVSKSRSNTNSRRDWA